MTATTDRPSSADAPRLRVSAARRRFHIPTILVGVLLVVGCAFGFGVAAQSLTEQRSVIVLSRPAERGTVLTAADLAVAHIPSDAGIRVLPAGERDRLIGRTLLTDLQSGAVLTPDLVTAGAVDLGPASRTVGLLLEPGAYPVGSLAAGDIVSVIDTGGRGTVLADEAPVLAVEPAVEGSATRLISVVVDARSATTIAAAAAQDRIRLSLRGVRP